jgi:hypothetical protein
MLLGPAARQIALNKALAMGCDGYRTLPEQDSARREVVALHMEALALKRLYLEANHPDIATCLDNVGVRVVCDCTVTCGHECASLSKVP